MPEGPDDLLSALEGGIGPVSNELPDAFGGDLPLQELDGGLPSAVDVEIVDVLGDLTEAGTDDVFNHFDPLGAPMRPDDIVVEMLPVDDDGTEETDEPVEVEVEPTPVDRVKLAAMLDEIVGAEVELGMRVEIDELLEDSTDADERGELWLRVADVELDVAVVDEGRLDVPVASELDEDEDVEV